ncbi:hydrogenase maturation nickel metallochaperone HypA [bacterium]|nr:hydrogenase maturation nickel metallochaperone HypA [bacterium]
MHESSMMTGLMRQIESIARVQDATRVVGVTLRIGVMTNISPDHLREHFAMAARGTIAEDADLSIVEEENPASPFANQILLEAIDVAG